MSGPTPKPPWWTVPRLAAAVGLAAFLAVLATIGDPGITVDEPLDVRPGRTYVALLRAHGPGFLAPATVARAFADNREHPPLGRWLLGIASLVGEPFEVLLRGPDPTGLYVRSGRLAPAAAFGMLAGIVALAAGRAGGRAAAAGAGFAAIAMPRMFAHAHIAALDTFITLFWTWALLAAERAFRPERPIRAAGLAGIVWGLALLTKIHAWLLPPLVLAWAIARLPLRTAWKAYLAWLSAGLALYFAGWPWLWYDPAGRLSAYLRTGVDRTAILVQYFGHVYADRDVPWHYPWFYFAATVPVGLHLLGLAGVWRAHADRDRAGSPALRLVAMTGLLLLFSTKAPVYDGERLFLPAFALWAIFIGQGFAAAWTALRRPWARVLLAAFLLGQGYGTIALHPFGLSYYNLLVGGLRGAERLGLELTYWGDAVDDALLAELASAARPGSTAALAPTLAPNQGLVSTTGAMARLPLLMADESAASTADLIVVYRRTAYWKPEIARLTTQPPVALRTRQGVWLSGLWRRRTDRPKNFNSN